MRSRRDMLARGATVAGLLAAAGLLPAAAQSARSRAAFEARTMAEAARALGGGAPAESPEVTLGGPDIAENGAAVPLDFASTAGGVKLLLLLVEQNPTPLAAVFEVGDGVDAAFTTRVKMAQSSRVYAVAILADGRVLYAARTIEVTLGGCGD
jgi:sulfur-oxidizing protein SoxY